MRYKRCCHYKNIGKPKSIGIVIALIACVSVRGQQNSTSLFKSSVLTAVNSFTNGVEGPAVDKEGNLYAVNFNHQGSIGKITPAGESALFIDLPAGSIGNGIRFNKKGEMLVADYTMHNVLRVDMGTKQITVYAHDSTMSQPNDIAIDNRGCLFASDPDWKNSTGRLWYVNKKGKFILLEDKMGTTNGVEVSPDNKRLYVNESAQRKVWMYDLSKKGKISNKRLLIEFPDFGMDGMRCDVKGNLYIARYGKGVVAVVSPAGELLREIELTGKKPTNVAFGGTDGRTVYVTLQDQGNIESFLTDTPGREWQMQQHK
ncbi:MAG: SMP-30/gluconolactonase/LRE family protein [Chitinophagaceae bacterium]